MASTIEAPPPAPTGALQAQAQVPATKRRRLLVLLHGEKANDDAVRDAIRRVREDGHEVNVRVTFEAGDVDRLVKEVLALDSADTLVAAGGDGTVREVVAAVLHHTGGLKDTRRVEPPPPEPNSVVARAAGDPPTVLPVSVAVLPLGTSNDFAACTGIPTDLYEALSLGAREDTLRPIDIGLLNGEVFLNTATIGASADLGLMTSSAIKRILGPLAFLVTGVRSIRRWQPVQSVLCFPEIKEHGAYAAQQQQPTAKGASLTGALSAELHAEEALVVQPTGGTSSASSRFGSATGEPAGDAGTAPAAAKAAAMQAGGGQGVGKIEGVPLLHATAANSRQVASMVAISPDALLDDGMLDILYLTGNVAQHVKRVLLDWLWKGSRRTKVVKSLLRVPWLEVATETPMPYSVDGEPLPPTTKFRYSLLHRAVRFHLPDDRMLVAGQATPEPQDAELAAQRKKGKGKGLSNPLRIPRGRLRPPSLADMVGRVVRFRKQKRWGQMFKGLAKTLLVASLGGLAVHWWHRSRAQEPEEKGKDKGKGRRASRKRRGSLKA